MHFQNLSSKQMRTNIIICIYCCGDYIMYSKIIIIYLYTFTHVNNMLINNLKNSNSRLRKFIFPKRLNLFHFFFNSRHITSTTSEILPTAMLDSLQSIKEFVAAKFIGSYIK